MGAVDGTEVVVEVQAEVGLPGGPPPNVLEPDNVLDGDNAPKVVAAGVAMALLWGFGLPLGTGLRTRGLCSLGTSEVKPGTPCNGGGESGGDSTIGGDPKCIGGGDVTWLGVVLPEAKNMSEVGVSLVDEAIEKVVEDAGLYTMASLGFARVVEAGAVAVDVFRIGPDTGPILEDGPPTTPCIARLSRRLSLRLKLALLIGLAVVAVEAEDAPSSEVGCSLLAAKLATSPVENFPAE